MVPPIIGYPSRKVNGTGLSLVRTAKRSDSKRKLTAGFHSCSRHSRQWMSGVGGFGLLMSQLEGGVTCRLHIAITSKNNAG